MFFYHCGVVSQSELHSILRTMLRTQRVMRFFQVKNIKINQFNHRHFIQTVIIMHNINRLSNIKCGFNNVRCINNNIKTYTNNLFWFAQIIFWTNPFLISVENNFILFNRTPRKNNALRQAWFTILFYSRFFCFKSFMHNRFPGDFFIHNFVQLKGGKVGFRIKNLIFLRNACIRPQNSLYRRNLPWTQWFNEWYWMIMIDNDW